MKMKSFLLLASFFLSSSSIFGSILIITTIPKTTSFQYSSMTPRSSPRLFVPTNCNGYRIYYCRISLYDSSHYRTSYIHRIRRSRILFAETTSTTDVVSSKVGRFLRKQGFANNKVNVLCDDPLVYTVSDLLSQSECIDYQKYAIQNKDMTLSNPPDVSLDISKLWPLPFLSIGFGVPPYIRLMEAAKSSNNIDTNLQQEILFNVLPPILVSLTLMIMLAWFVVLPLAKLISKNQSRTSTATALNLDEDVEFIRPLVERLSNAIYKHNDNVDIGSTTNWEAPVITKYDTGAIFARHNDASPTKGSEWITIGGQRIVTCICYLNTLSDSDSNDSINIGGGTYFDVLNINVQPTAGTVLIFYPSDSKSFDADDRTTHESKPVKSGEKWIVQLFGRIQPVPPPLGLPVSFYRTNQTSML